MNVGAVRGRWSDRCAALAGYRSALAGACPVTPDLQTRRHHSGPDFASLPDCRAAHAGPVIYCRRVGCIFAAYVYAVLVDGVVRDVASE
jgi:hypothetical protein